MVEQTGQTDPIDSVRLSVPAGRQTGRAVLLSAFILLFGVVIGAGGVYLWLNDRIMYPQQGRFDHAKKAQNIVGKMKTRYDLTDEQVGRVERIFARQFEAMAQWRQGLDSKIDQTRQQMVDEIRDVLTEEQFGRWEKKFQDRMRRWRGRGQGGGRRRERRGTREQGPGRQEPAPPSDRPDGPGPGPTPPVPPTPSPGPE